MKNIIKRLYNGQILDSEQDASKLYQTEEFKEFGKRLEELEATFNEEQKQLFREYELANGLFSCIEEDEVYTHGFKTGFCRSKTKTIRILQR